MSKKSILVSGGAGFIGSHTCKALAQQGYLPVTIDNLGTGNRDAVKWGPLVEGDVRNESLLRSTIFRHRPDAVIHFAASAYVGESVQNPGKYYDNNVGGLCALLKACTETGLENVVFSSSCATYGIPDTLPISEESPQRPINPYGMTKLIGEHMLKDFAKVRHIRFAALRYFNACGADPDGELVENHDPETHLIPLALMAASGTGQALDVFGTDYETPDGTCIRDYIHVCDLARAHVAACQHLLKSGENLHLNVGTGTGLSIRQILSAIENLTGEKLPVSFSARRPGDPPELYADPSRIRNKLGFETTMSDIDFILRSAAPTFGLDLGKIFHAAE